MLSMLSKPIAIALLAATCVIAAAGGAYLAIARTTRPTKLRPRCWLQTRWKLPRPPWR